ncbi:hypothetical protein MML48_7g00015981 [Holotrichia oblita]|uniref:Uncharacterized protein n=1 Tax=Holotrichia oblita TaxID=644536 RepID=A0ACB9SVE0_HOLOL|nr:hypothetical protein MML48_7g00015981 [Holotrichia oblita]
MEDLLNIFELDESSSSSEEEEIEMELFLPNPRNLRIPSRIENFVEITVENFTNKEFQENFRISRKTFFNLLQRLTPSLERNEGLRGRNRIPVDRQILSVLWLLATPDSYRSVGNRFNMGKSSLSTCFYRVMRALNEIAPEAICSPNLMFTDCFAGYPSSVSDIRIFRNSDIYHKFITERQNYFGYDEYIIGDKAYPVTGWCITPYIDRGRLTERQIQFNTIHARTRQVIERSFALLFGRFRRLKYLDMNRVDLIPSTIIAACTLHNICLMQPDDVFGEYVNEGFAIVNNGEDVAGREDQQNEGHIRRDYLAANL